jgi:hypothetical protein
MKDLTAASVASGYFEWLLEEATREAESGCARLKRVQDQFPAYFLEQTAGWPASEVATLMRARIKKMAWTREKPKLTQDEQQLSTAIEWPVFDPELVGRTKIVWELNRRYRQGEFKVDKSALRRLVRARMDRSFGKPMLVDGVTRYMTEVGEVVVCTDVEYPTKGFTQFQSCQCLLRKAEGGPPGSRILLVASVFHLAGLRLDTAWSTVRTEDMPSAVDNLADLSAEFIEQVPRILEAAHRHMDPPSRSRKPKVR